MELFYRSSQIHHKLLTYKLKYHWHENFDFIKFGYPNTSEPPGPNRAEFILAPTNPDIRRHRGSVANSGKHSSLSTYSLMQSEFVTRKFIKMYAHGSSFFELNSIKGPK